MPIIKTAVGLGVALGLGLLVGISGAEARGGFGGHGGFGGGGMMFFPHRAGGFGGGGFAMNGHPGFHRFGMTVPGERFSPMGFRHGNFHDFRHARFDRFHHHFFGFPFFVAAGFPSYYDYGYGGCGWAYRNARATGSPYWWNRYYACISYGY
jgi:hypothetical protein